MDAAPTGRAAAKPVSPLIKWVLPVGIAALTIALIGGYDFHWSWTGVNPSDKMWDLLHVVVLPAVLATLPIWYRTRQRWMIAWRVVFGILGLAFVSLVVGGYALGWVWTGFQGNTFWDWLELLALPVVVASLPLWFATHRRFEGRWRVVGITALVFFVVVVVGGYSLDWGWTGFRGNMLWDWLRLLLVPFVLPATLAWFSGRAESERASESRAPA